MRRLAARLLPLLAIPVLPVALAACDATEPAGVPVAADESALAFPLPPITLPPVDLESAFTLKVHTCSAAGSESVDPVQALLQWYVPRDGGGPDEAHGSTVDLTDAAATRDGWFSHRLLVRETPLDLEQLRSLIIRKQGHDKWCIDQVQLVQAGFPVWFWDTATPQAAPPYPSYAGPAPVGQPILLDDDRAEAPASSVRFADYWVQYTNLDVQRPVELEVQTCTEAQQAGAGTTDPVGVTVYHEGESDLLPLDHGGTERTAGKTDRYLVDEQGVHSLPFIVLRKSGTDRWCVQRVAVFAAGVKIAEKTGKWLVDSADVRIDVDAFAGTMYPQHESNVGLPLQASTHWTFGFGGANQSCRTCSGDILQQRYCDRCNSDLACGDDGLCHAAGGHGQLCQEPVMTFPGMPAPARCDAGLTCNLGFCRTPGENLGPCRATGSACDSGLSCTAGTCRRPGSEDGPCRALDDAAGPRCDARLVCDAGLCTPHQEVSSFGNQCVNHVRETFAHLDAGSSTKLHLRVGGLQSATRPGYQTTPWWAPQLESRQDDCHIQGFQRLNVPGFLAFTANSRSYGNGVLNHCDDLPVAEGGGANLFIGRVPSKAALGNHAWGSLSAASNDSVVREVRLNYDGTLGVLQNLWQNLINDRSHPGGFQVAGDYLYVGMDGTSPNAELEILNVRDPMSPTLVGKITTSTKQASATAAVELTEGKILVGVGHLSKSGPRVIHLYYVDPHQPTFQPVFVGDLSSPDFQPYASINFVRECDTDDVYMIGINNDSTFPMCAGDLGSIGGAENGYFHLYKLSYGYTDHPGNVSIQRVDSREAKNNNASGCAGTGVFVGYGGDLDVYQMEHNSDDGQIRFYEYPTVH